MTCFIRSGDQCSRCFSTRRTCMSSLRCGAKYALKHALVNRNLIVLAGSRVQARALQLVRDQLAFISYRGRLFPGSPLHPQPITNINFHLLGAGATRWSHHSRPARGASQQIVHIQNALRATVGCSIITCAQILDKKSVVFSFDGIWSRISLE